MPGPPSWIIGGASAPSGSYFTVIADVISFTIVYIIKAFRTTEQQSVDMTVEQDYKPSTTVVISHTFCMENKKQAPPPRGVAIITWGMAIIT